MNMDAKIFNKKSVNYIKNILKNHSPRSSVFTPKMQDRFNIYESVNMIHHINKRKDKNHTIISIDAEKELDKAQDPFMIKTLNKLGLGKHMST